MDQDRGEVTWSHLQTNIGLIKNSAVVRQNRRVDTKIKQLPPCLLGGTWHPTYMEHHYAKQNLYQLKRRYRQQQYWMQGCLHLQLRRGGGFSATAEEIYATRTKEEEMVQELLKDWQKGAHGYIPKVKEDNVI